MNEERPTSRATLSAVPNANPHADQAVDAAVARWCEIDAALSPIIGARGVAALFRRSVNLQKTTYPWLAEASADAERVGDFSGLRTAFRGQTRQVGLAANQALHQTFVALLGGLIGSSLTERLIVTQLDPHSSGPAVQQRPP